MTPSEFTLRTAAPGDIEVLLRHRRGMFLDMGCSPHATDLALSAARTYFSHALADGSCCGWLALHGQDIVGGGILVIVDWPGVPGCALPKYPWILNVYVEPEFRRRGVAGMLMNAMIDYCRQAGFSSVALHPSAEGQPLYEKLGFTITSEMRLSLQEPTTE